MRPDVLHAMTDDGRSLPVIDVTNPAFAVTATEGELAAMSEQFVLESKQRPEMPAPLREALQRSVLGRGLIAAAGTFLTGMNTYLLKLGPDNLGTDADPIDRRIAESFPAFTARLRLQDMARLLADGLVPTLGARPGRPVCLINIAGGPAADSWNALIHLHDEHSALLSGREIRIVVLDLDDRGPGFGGRALAALGAPGGRLSGLEIGFQHVTYEWSDADRLRQALDDLHATEAACAISTEAGLFEYGSDMEIVTNLANLRAGTAPDASVVGSVTRDGEPVRWSQAASRVSTRPRTIEAFRDLADQAGWTVQRVIERPFSYHVRLVPAG